MRLCLGFDAGTLRNGLGRCDNGVRFCVSLRLRRKDAVRLVQSGEVVPRAGTYVAGFGLDAGDREDTLLLLDLVAVFPIDILWGCSDKVPSFGIQTEKTYSSLHLGLQSALGKLVHCAGDLA